MAKGKGNKLSMLTDSVPSPATAYKPSATAYKPSAAEQAERRRYQAEDDLRTITRAAEIQRDRPRMSMVRKLATEQVKTLKPLTRKR